MELATRRVHVGGTTTNPTSAWMEQIARNGTDCEVGFLRGKRYLIVDRDSVFAPRFKTTLGGAGVEVLATAYQAPNMNAHAERFVRSIRAECLDQMIFVGRGSLERSVAEYVAHYHGERSHLGVGNEIPARTPPQREGVVSEDSTAQLRPGIRAACSSTIIERRREPRIEFSDTTPLRVLARRQLGGPRSEFLSAPPWRQQEGGGPLRTAAHVR